LIAQLELAATAGMQVLLSVQPLEIVTVLTVSGIVLGFVKVTTCGGLELPSSSLPKVKLAGEILAAATVPSPLSAIVSGLPSPV